MESNLVQRTERKRTTLFVVKLNVSIRCQQYVTSFISLRFILLGVYGSRHMAVPKTLPEFPGRSCGLEKILLMTHHCTIFVAFLYKNSAIADKPRDAAL